MREDYEAEHFCKTCNKDTVHEVHCDGHERDSSGDYRECKECGTLIVGSDPNF